MSKQKTPSRLIKLNRIPKNAMPVGKPVIHYSRSASVDTLMQSDPIIPRGANSYYVSDAQPFHQEGHYCLNFFAIQFYRNLKQH